MSLWYLLLEKSSNPVVTRQILLISSVWLLAFILSLSTCRQFRCVYCIFASPISRRITLLAFLRASTIAKNIRKYLNLSYWVYI